MNLYVQRMSSKLPRAFSILDRTHFRGVYSLPYLNSTGCMRAFLATTAEDFRFAHSSGLHTYSAGSPCTVIALRKISNVLLVPRRGNASAKQTNEASKKKSLVEAKESPYAHLTVGQKVKEAGKDASYLAVIVVGIAVTGLMFYVIGRELFSSQSPSGIYGDALKKCQNNIEVAAALGEPIKGYGETTRRGRRRHVSHTEFEVRGVLHMRMRFYIEGPYKKGTVHVEVQKGDSGKFDYRYLVVETEGYPQRSFVLEDNR